MKNKYMLQKIAIVFLLLSIFGLCKAQTQEKIDVCILKEYANKSKRCDSANLVYYHKNIVENYLYAEDTTGSYIVELFLLSNILSCDGLYSNLWDNYLINFLPNDSFDEKQKDRYDKLMILLTYNYRNSYIESILKKRIIDKKNIDTNNPYFKIYISLIFDEFDRIKFTLNSMNAKRFFDNELTNYDCL